MSHYAHPLKRRDSDHVPEGISSLPQGTAMSLVWFEPSGDREVDRDERHDDDVSARDEG